MSRSAIHRSRAVLLPWLLPALLCACQPQTQPGPEPSDRAASSADWPGPEYTASAKAGETVFLLDPQATEIDIVVRRDGPLARFGHDHVVTVQDAEGFLQLDRAGQASRADLRFRLDRLVVDSATSRQRHDLDTDPDASDIEGTRDNLMTHVLNPHHWPWATLGLEAFSRQDDHYSAMVTIGINGSEHSSRQPFHLRREGGRATVEGFFVIRQTELGLEPFSTLGGGLRVADPLEIHFHIEASRL